ncbi:MAG TPA: MarR family transcriptional regulator [Xanthobacteraceae bacterium]|jgi:DNA-binding MarR family transcriptional regulator
MPDISAPSEQTCNCYAVRAAARHVTQHYDHFLAPTGLRISQFGILTRLKIYGPLTISELAEKMAIDRTTLGRNIRPLERDGLIDIAPKASDRRVKEIRLSAAGTKRLEAARKRWQMAQEQFETNFGPDRAAELRGLLRTVTALETPPPAQFARDL